jgi:hypothetical protein
LSNPICVVCAPSAQYACSPDAFLMVFPSKNRMSSPHFGAAAHALPGLALLPAPTPLPSLPWLCVVAEPPKLYGPHAPVIVLKTSDGYACTPDNLRRSVGCPHRTLIQLYLTTHTRINKGVTTTLQHLYKTLHQSAEE